MKSDSQHLIVGGDSKLARQLALELNIRGVKFDSTSRNQRRINSNTHFLDLNTTSDYSNFVDYEVIYFLAGISSISQCERDKEESLRINVTNTIQLLKHFSEISAHIVYPSSNHIFDGLSPNKTHLQDERPQSFYGELKKAVETEIFQNFRNYTIVRLGKVLSPGLSVLETWCDALVSGGEITVKDNHFISPVTINVACQVLAHQGIARSQNLVQLSAPDDISYQEIFEIFSRHFEEIGHSNVRHTTTAVNDVFGSMAKYGLSDLESIQLPSSRKLIEEIVEKSKIMYLTKHNS